MEPTTLKKILDNKVKQYNNLGFIKNDPICIPHQFSKKQDIEIAAFFAAILAWGNRTSIINSASKLMQLMQNSPHHFILHHQSKDLKNLMLFKHRTFNATDLFYCIEFLQMHYQNFDSLENAFLQDQKKFINVENSLINFRNYFFCLDDYPKRTGKHFATPQKRSACKRLNMLLRWMVRKDNAGVDFGLWKTILQSELICPLDVHVANVSVRLGILQNNKSNWQNAITLTSFLKTLNGKDPVIYDYALFSLGVQEKFK